MTNLTKCTGYCHLDEALDFGLVFMDSNRESKRRQTKPVEEKILITVSAYFSEYACEIDECDNITIMWVNGNSSEMYFAIDIFKSCVRVLFYSLQEIEYEIPIDHSTELTEEWFFQMQMVYDLTGISFEQFQKIIQISKRIPEYDI